MPEIAEISKQVMIEETKQGLNIDTRGSERQLDVSGGLEGTIRAHAAAGWQRLSGPLKALPYRVSISGHTAATKLPGKPGYGPWELSADRANSIRKILEEEGVPTASFFMVAGRPTRSPVPGRSLRRGQSPRHDYPDARGPAIPGNLSLELAELFSTQQLTLGAVVFGRGCINRPCWCDATKSALFHDFSCAMTDVAGKPVARPPRLWLIAFQRQHLGVDARQRRRCLPATSARARSTPSAWR